jgi:hypothetical protein
MSIIGDESFEHPSRSLRDLTAPSAPSGIAQWPERIQ